MKRNELVELAKKDVNLASSIAIECGKFGELADHFTSKQWQTLNPNLK